MKQPKTNATDKTVGAEREQVGEKLLWGHNAGSGAGSFSKNRYEGQTGIKRMEPITAPATPEAQLWDGYGTGLKPAWEPIILAMKPLDGTFAQNALEHGVAGLNIDGGRIDTQKPIAINTPFNSWRNLEGREDRQKPKQTYNANEGRFPANLLLSHDPDCTDTCCSLFCPVRMLDEQSGQRSSGYMKPGQQRKATLGGGGYHGNMPDEATAAGTYGDTGGASRFFYCAKSSRAERGDGNNHPTVKPLALMRYLIKLLAPPGNPILLDPFMGSGSTLVEAWELGIKSIGIDIDEASCEIAAKRMSQTVMRLEAKA